MFSRPLADWIWMRPVLALASLALGYGLWAAVVRDPWFDSGEELLAALAVAFAILAGSQVILSWVSSPTPIIEPHTSLPTPIVVPQLAVHHLAVWNHELPPPVRPLVLRLAPEGCQLRVRYFDADTGQPMLCGQWLLARWNDNPEPVIEEKGGLSIQAMVRNRRLQMKLFPSERRGHHAQYAFTVAFAIKLQGDDHFYHFNDESYQWGGATRRWLNPGWRMPRGVYRVEAELRGYGLIHPSVARFRLRNEGVRHEDFILEPWPS